MLNEAFKVLESKREKKVAGADELFGQSIGESLKTIPDLRCKEYVKPKIQELIFQARGGLMNVPVAQNRFSPINNSRNTSQSTSYTSLISSPLSPEFMANCNF